MYKLVCTYNKQYIDFDTDSENENDNDSDSNDNPPEYIFKIYFNDIVVTELTISDCYKVVKEYKGTNVSLNFNDMNGGTDFILKDNICTLELSVAGGNQGIQQIKSIFVLSDVENTQFLDELDKFS